MAKNNSIPFNKIQQNAGDFTAKASRHGMGVQEFASYVHTHPDNFDSHTKHQAAFAKAAKSFSHKRALGGSLLSYGGAAAEQQPVFAMADTPYLGYNPYAAYSNPYLAGGRYYSGTTSTDGNEIVYDQYNAHDFWYYMFGATYTDATTYDKSKIDGYIDEFYNTLSDCLDGTEYERYKDYIMHGLSAVLFNEYFYLRDQKKGYDVSFIKSKNDLSYYDIYKIGKKNEQYDDDEVKSMINLFDDLPSRKNERFLTIFTGLANYFGTDHNVGGLDGLASLNPSTYYSMLFDIATHMLGYNVTNPSDVEKVEKAFLYYSVDKYKIGLQNPKKVTDALWKFIKKANYHDNNFGNKSLDNYITKLAADFDDEKLLTNNLIKLRLDNSDEALANFFNYKTDLFTPGKTTRTFPVPQKKYDNDDVSQTTQADIDAANQPDLERTAPADTAQAAQPAQQTETQAETETEEPEQTTVQDTPENVQDEREETNQKNPRDWIIRLPDLYHYAKTQIKKTNEVASTDGVLIGPEQNREISEAPITASRNAGSSSSPSPIRNMTSIWGKDEIPDDRYAYFNTYVAPLLNLQGNALLQSPKAGDYSYDVMLPVWTKEFSVNGKKAGKDYISALYGTDTPYKGDATAFYRDVDAYMRQNAKGRTPLEAVGADESELKKLRERSSNEYSRMMSYYNDDKDPNAPWNLTEEAMSAVRGSSSLHPYTYANGNYKYDNGGAPFANGGNMRKFIYAYGGSAADQHGGHFTNGVTTVNAGGTHEANTYGGVQMGADNDGTPNLVEQGEVVYGDYVFSNRMNVSDDELKSIGLTSSRYKHKTFAQIAALLQKESSERPLDSISERGLQSMLSRLARLQEARRQQMGVSGSNQLQTADEQAAAYQTDEQAAYEQAMAEQMAAQQQQGQALGQANPYQAMGDTGAYGYSENPYDSIGDTGDYDQSDLTGLEEASYAFGGRMPRYSRRYDGMTSTAPQVAPYPVTEQRPVEDNSWMLDLDSRKLNRLKSGQGIKAPNGKVVKYSKAQGKRLYNDILSARNMRNYLANKALEREFGNIPYNIGFDYNI